MSTPPVENTTPSVQKQTRRFAPTIRGRGRGRGSGPADASADASSSTATDTVQVKVEADASIGHVQSEGPVEGRLQSVHGPKTRGGAAKFFTRSPRLRTTSAIDQAIKSDSRDGGRGRGRGRGRGMVVEEVSASGIFSLGPSAAGSRSRSNMMASMGAAASYGGDVSQQYDENGADTDMMVLFGRTLDTNTPDMVNHVARTAGELEPSDLTRTRTKAPWTKTKTDNDKMDIDTPVKSEGAEKDGGEGADTQSTTQEPWLMEDDAPARHLFAVNENNKVVSVADDELLFFQLPKVVPQFDLPVKEDEVNEDVDMVKDKEADLPAPAQKATLEEKMNQLSLSEMPNGSIGKLVVFKSGKIKLKMGDILYDLDNGMTSSFLENLMVVDTESEQLKKSIELGHLVQKFTCIPNINSLLEGHEYTSS
ncbi:hypothetical protein DM01DRAFT_1331658 [Hesseltinella vesiculosa]|uniref:RNA polymerase III RPC4-domain-containing protein n=1 Tax=Hesseltinella vesiculosa TaxID=101127 RepID=A0A1X2GVY9_9FUNG|nr:hypothetical protein DM01DRAFT_1331658 [Hesseltinella vesiculosa]